MIDTDDAYYTADVLFDWRLVHESFVRSRIGRPLGEASSEPEFKGESRLACRIVEDRPLGWEYRLTAELLKTYISKPIRRWKDLAGGLYSRPRSTLHETEAVDWIRSQLSSAMELIEPIPKLVNVELCRVWGPPGTAGDPVEILHVCRLIGEAAQRLVEWEEMVRFTRVPESMARLQDTFPGLLAHQLEQLSSVPNQLHHAVDRAEAEPGKKHEFVIEIVFATPDRWVESVERELARMNTPTTSSMSWFR